MSGWQTYVIDGPTLEQVSARRAESWQRKAKRIADSFFARHLANQKITNRQARLVLNRYYRDVISEVRKIYRSAGVAPTAGQLQIFELRLTRLTNRLAVNMQNVVQSSILSTADLVAIRESQTILATASKGLPREIAAVLADPFEKSALAKTTLDILWNTTLGTKITLSQDLWALQSYTHARVSKILSGAINKGLHPTEAARLLKKELVPSAQVVGKEQIWSKTAAQEVRGVVGASPRGIVTRIGPVSYNYLRVARTEMLRAHRTAHVLRANFLMTLPAQLRAANGVRWVLSAAHPRMDICDDWASDDPDGLGPGVYLPPNVPMGHPLDMCTTQTELVPPGQFAKNVQSFLLDSRVGPAKLAQGIKVSAGSYLAMPMHSLSAMAAGAGTTTPALSPMGFV